MSNGSRHFAKLKQTKDEAIILGYRMKTNEVLICIPAALPGEDATKLRELAMSAEGQGADYLMEYVLANAHHVSGTDWQTYVIKQSNHRRGAVRSVGLNDLDFLDPTQKAFYAGYGPSIEPEREARRKARREIQEANMAGKTLPEPSEAEIAARIAQYQRAEAAVAVPERPVKPDQTEMMMQMMATLAQGQAALAEAIQGLKVAPAAPEKQKAQRKPRAKAKVKETIVAPDTLVGNTE